MRVRAQKSARKHNQRQNWIGCENLMSEDEGRSHENTQ